jgi:hypothetical protein
MHWFRSRKSRITLAVVAVLTVAAIAAGSAIAIDQGGKWEAGDMHTHTFLTDGSNTQLQVVQKAFNEYGLDWMANSEHGGSYARDPFGNAIASQPRWWSLMNYSYPIIRDLRPMFPDQTLIQGLEWNVPKGEHASIGIVSNEPSAVAEFEARFDKSDTSTSFPGLVSKDSTTHAGAVNAVAWLQANYADSSYFVLNHPSRALAYTPGDVRDFLTAGPNVTAGFEGLPGHQKEADRSGYTSSNPLARTYQGADAWLAPVGGFWDSLLANGYRYSVYTNSDFHYTGGDFWPGEFAKNWTWVAHPEDPKSLVAGLKSGASFSAMGDLVDELKFSATGNGKKVDMGRDALTVPRGKDVVVTIKFHTPLTNNNGDSPKMDHLDLIAGNVTGAAVQGTASWDASTNPTAQVVKTFEGKSLQNLGNGWYAATYLVHNVQGAMYLRLRGTNCAPNTPGATDAAGNPLMDAPGANSAANAWKTLWFYSNPVWINVK